MKVFIKKCFVAGLDKKEKLACDMDNKEQKTSDLPTPGKRPTSSTKAEYESKLKNSSTPTHIGYG